MSSPFDDTVAKFTAADTDVVIYSGGIGRDGYEKFCKILSQPKRSKLLFILNTYGGDPNAGYRIARAAVHNYGAADFHILIPTFCKSAGTLICIGSTHIVMADQAELGPLDVQLRKQDELFQQSSGLDILRGVTFLQDEALSTFRSYLVDINGGAVLSTRVASEIASELVIGLYEPLFAQVDPVKLGEMNAALEIARHYGERLDRQSMILKEGALTKLIMGYPTHGFVIDRAEARQLFKNVTAPDNDQKMLCDLFRESPLSGAASATSAIVLKLNPIAKLEVDQPENPNEHVAERPTAADPHGNPAQEEQSAAEHDVEPPGDNEQEQPSVGGEQGDAVANEPDAQQIT